MDRLVGASHLVFHLAAVVSVGHVLRDPVHPMKVNVHGTENVLASALRDDVRVLLASSSEV